MKSVKLEPGRQTTPSLIRIASVLFWLALWQAAALLIGNSIILAVLWRQEKRLFPSCFSQNSGVFFSPPACGSAWAFWEPFSWRQSSELPPIF